MKALLPAIVGLTLLLGPKADAQSWIPLSSGSWVPSEAEIGEVKATLQQLMQARAKDQGVTMRPWTSYTIQLIGEEDSGLRQVRIHGFCSIPERLNPHLQLLHVDDGGPCYFVAVYDVESQSYIRAIFNGEA